MAEQVYLIGCKENSLVKIGRSISVHQRLKAIQLMCPVTLELLWHTDGGSELEARLHSAFRTRRSHGEWFDFAGVDPVREVQAYLNGRSVSEDAVKDEPSGSTDPYCFTFVYGQQVQIIAPDWPGPPVGVVTGISTFLWSDDVRYRVGEISSGWRKGEFLFEGTELRPLDAPVRASKVPWPSTASGRTRNLRREIADWA